MNRSRKDVYDELLTESGALNDLATHLWGEVIDDEPTDKLLEVLADIADMNNHVLVPLVFELRALESLEKEDDADETH